MIGTIISLIISGLVVGALGRLVIPGKNPMGIGMTIGVGIVGALVGGLIAYFVGLGLILTIVLEVAVAAGIVYVLTGSRKHPGGRLSRR